MFHRVKLAEEEARAIAERSKKTMAACYRNMQVLEDSGSFYDRQKYRKSDKEFYNMMNEVKNVTAGVTGRVVILDEFIRLAGLQKQFDEYYNQIQAADNAAKGRG